MPHLNIGRRALLAAVVLLFATGIVAAGTPPLRAFAQQADSPVVQLMAASEADLNTFWEQTFADENLGSYQPPSGVTAYQGETPTDTPCGETEANNAFFCPEDKGIYYDITWFEQEYNKSENNGYAVVGIMAHEWGHYIQDLLEQELQLNEGHFSIEIELQADCLAGNFTRFLYDGNGTLEITNEDLKAGMNGFFNVGDNAEDEAGIPWDNPDAHGTSAQRSQAFLMGFNQTVQICLDTSRIAEIVAIEGDASAEATPSK
jgi:hypothetical protein